MSERRFCEKNDHDMEDWNKAFPNKPQKFMKCGHPLPCPWHTHVIIEGGPRVIAAPISTQKERTAVRRLAVEIQQALESED